MPTETWNITTIDGKQYLVVDVAKFRIPLDWDPSSNMFFAVSYPDGGIGNFTALAKGDPGDVPTLNLPIALTELAADDPTPASASFTETSPDTYTLNLALHKGAKGDPGDTILQPSDYGTGLAGDYLVVDSSTNAFTLTPQRVGDRYLPATILAAPSGNAAYTLCTVPVPPQRFSWRPQVEGFCEITGTSADVKVDLVARLDSATAGNIVGRATQPAGSGTVTTNTTVVTVQGASGASGASGPTTTTTSTSSYAFATHVLSSTPPAGSDVGYDIVPAGESAVIYLRAERVAGSGTFTTSTTTTGFCVNVLPVPLSAE
jgi:hypothetical protein